jgi:integrase
MARLLQWRARMLFSEASTEWLIHNRRFKPRTQVHYEMVIGRFAKYAPIFADNIKAIHIEHYIDTVLQKYKNSTGNAHLAALKSFCRWLNEYYDLPNPCLKIKTLDEDPPEVRVLNDQEYQKVLLVCKPKERAVIRFLAHTGLRRSEFQQLSWNNITHDRRFIKLAVVKGRRFRMIPLNKTCQTILNNIPRKPDSTDMNLVKSYKAKDSIYRLCKKLARHAGIPRFGPHPGRRRKFMSISGRPKTCWVSLTSWIKMRGQLTRPPRAECPHDTPDPMIRDSKNDLPNLR